MFLGSTTHFWSFPAKLAAFYWTTWVGGETYSTSSVIQASWTEKMSFDMGMSESSFWDDLPPYCFFLSILIIAHLLIMLQCPSELLYICTRVSFIFSSCHMLTVTFAHTSCSRCFSPSHCLSDRFHIDSATIPACSAHQHWAQCDLCASHWERR